MITYSPKSRFPFRGHDSSESDDGERERQRIRSSKTNNVTKPSNDSRKDKRLQSSSRGNSLSSKENASPSPQTQETKAATHTHARNGKGSTNSKGRDAVDDSQHRGKTQVRVIKSGTIMRRGTAESSNATNATHSKSKKTSGHGRRSLRSALTDIQNRSEAIPEEADEDEDADGTEEGDHSIDSMTPEDRKTHITPERASADSASAEKNDINSLFSLDVDLLEFDVGDSPSTSSAAVSSTAEGAGIASNTAGGDNKLTQMRIAALRRELAAAQEREKLLRKELAAETAQSDRLFDEFCVYRELMEAALAQSEEQCPNENSSILLRAAVQRGDKHCSWR